MGGPSLIQFVAWGSTLLCVLGALWLLRLAVFRDKDRDKARCPKCWYELGRLDSPPALPVTCPECGKKVETLKEMSRLHLRRWPVLAVLPVLLAAWVCWELPRIKQRGWLWLVPDRVLFEVYPIAAPTSDLYQQFYYRLGIATWPDGTNLCTWDDSDVAALISKCARGNALAPRLSDKWKQSYGPLLTHLFQSNLPLPESPSRLASLGPPPPSLVAAMEEVANLPCDFGVTTRDLWPTAVVSQQLIGIDQTNVWWPRFWKIEGIIEWSATNGRGEAARGASPYERLQTHIEVPLQGEVTVDATIKLFKLPPAGGTGEKRLLIAHPFPWKYKTVATLDDAFTPVIDPRIDEALRGAKYRIENKRIVVDPTSVVGTPVEGVTFSLRMALRAGDRVIATGAAVWIGGQQRCLLYGRQGLDEAAPEAASLMGGVIPPGLTLTLTNDPSLAIQTQNTARLWTGEITFPLTPGAMPPPDAPARTPTPRR